MEQNKVLIERIFNEGINGKNNAVIEEIISPDYINHNWPAPVRGYEGFKAVINQFFDAFPDMKITVKHVLGDDDMVSTYGFWTGTNNGPFMGMPATGKQVRIEYMDLWKLKNGKAVENWVQMDNAAIMQQLGFMPQPT
jgi:steroid delta-isomerase-like uncharacterized protein